MALTFERQSTMDFLSWRDLLDPDHRLVRVSAALDWEALHERLAPYYSPVGRQAHLFRLHGGGPGIACLVADIDLARRVLAD